MLSKYISLQELVDNKFFKSCTGEIDGDTIRIFKNVFGNVGTISTKSPAILPDGSHITLTMETVDMWGITFVIHCGKASIYDVAHYLGLREVVQSVAGTTHRLRIL